MFVRPAQNHLEQNLVAYQYGSEIFYTTIKNIQPKEELKVSIITSETLMSLYYSCIPSWYRPLQVWYAASYAEFVNQKIHDVTEEERKGSCLHHSEFDFQLLRSLISC